MIPDAQRERIRAARKAVIDAGCSCDALYSPIQCHIHKALNDYDAALAVVPEAFASIHVFDPYKNRITEMVAYCPKHIGVGFAAYHIGYVEIGGPAGERERLFGCSFCGHQFPESQGMECDSR